MLMAMKYGLTSNIKGPWYVTTSQEPSIQDHEDEVKLWVLILLGPRDPRLP